jgi:ABC-type antimicrobial peptide transport system permease subunit
MTKKINKPPKIAQFLLTRLLNEYAEVPLLGDLEEEYRCVATESGKRYARMWYWRQVIKSLPNIFNNSIYWSSAMFKNYVKIAFRNLQRHKMYSSLNIIGLAVGILCSLLISLWVLDELSYDRFHTHADRLYRVEFDQNYSGQLYHVNVSPHPMAPALVQEIPEIENATRVNPMGELLVKHAEKTFFEDSVMAVDPSFLEMFSYPLLQGDVRTALADPYSIILTEDRARTYFGHGEAIGRTLNINNSMDFTVTGVMKDIPRTGYLQFDALVPYELLRTLGRDLEQWDNNTTLTFSLLQKNTQPDSVASKIHALVTKHDSGEDQTYSLRPLTEIHLYSYFGFGGKRGNAQYVALFSAIAIFVLLIACINFMNLSTARSAKRAREVGVRKVVGAVKRQIIMQFYGESCIFTFLALILALICVNLALPAFNTLTGKDISFAALTSGSTPLAVLGILLTTGFIAGSYPALFLSSFHPVKVLKGTVSSGASGRVFRKILVVVQFSLSISLIIGTGIVYSQLNYMKEKTIGFETDHLLAIQMRGSVKDSYGALKKELLKHSGVVAVSASNSKPSGIYSNAGGADWEGKDPERDVSVHFASVDYDYFEAADMEMVGGRSYSLDFPSDSESAYVVNEELQRLMGVDSAVGKQFTFGERTGTIVGVVKDFHFLSLRKKIEPLVLLLRPQFTRHLLIRIQPGNVASTLDGLERTWSRVVPGFPFDFEFINEDFEVMYRTEQRMGSVLKYFSFLAVFVACLGLFGLASFAAEQRTREIGIRKVLGASIPRIAYLLCREFTFLVLLANLVAWPVVYLAMRNWLGGFAYRTSIGWEIFFLAGFMAFVIALLTVSYQALKTALSNPVRALKYE